MGERRTLGRVGVFFLALFFVGGVLSFALFQKQVLDHEQYAKASMAQSVSLADVPAQRGRIFAKDRDKGLVNLALSEWRYNLVVSPQLIKNKQKFTDLLAKDFPKLQAADILAAINNDKVFVILAKGLSIEEANTISRSNYRGVSLMPTLVRSYPEGEMIAAQVLGFVGADGEGKYGVEAIHNDLLHGQAGSQRQKKDSFGQLIDVLGGKSSTPGRDLVLTFDYNLQFIVETKLKEALEEFKADAGSIVVMDPQNGAILALAGQPTFDPNNFSLLRGDEQSKFLAPAASNIYEPGSVMKPITMAMALDLGRVTPETTGVFGKTVTVGGKTIMNADEKVFGKETMIEVLENSDNVAMVWVASQIGTEAERDYFVKFGLGVESGLDLVGEQTGRLPAPNDWNDLLRSTAAFGQGVSVTLVQLATAYSVIANGGNLVTPHLAEKTLLDDKVTALDYNIRGQVIKAEVAAQVRQMLASVVVNGHGKRARVEGVGVGGKTGTAQVPNPAGGYYDDRHIGTFAGMFPIDQPKFVMAVRLDNPKTVKFAESSAAPTFGRIAEWMANYYQLR